jgi:hypothetical protein
MRALETSGMYLKHQPSDHLRANDWWINYENRDASWASTNFNVKKGLKAYEFK